MRSVATAKSMSVKCAGRALRQAGFPPDADRGKPDLDGTPRLALRGTRQAHRSPDRVLFWRRMSTPAITMPHDHLSATPSVKQALDAARLALREGRPTDAEETMQGVLSAEPENMEILRVLGHAALARGNAGAAIEWLNRAAALDRNDIALLLDLGVAYRIAERMDAARYVLERALELSRGRDTTARLLLAQVLEQDRRPELALLHYFRAILDAQHAGRWLDDETTEPGLRILVRHAMAYVAHDRRAWLAASLQPWRNDSSSGGLDRVERSLATYLRERNDPPDDPRQRAGILYVPGLGATPVLENAHFEWMSALLTRVASATAEVEACLRSAHAEGSAAAPFSPLQPPTAAPDDERCVSLLAGGHVTDIARLHAPQLLTCLADTPLAKIPCYGPEASIVCIPPGVRTPIRHGPSNAHCRVAIALTGSGHGKIVVGGETFALQEGSGMVFDPSFGATCFNPGEGEVRLLRFDIWHPRLSELERDALTALILAIVDFDTRLQELA